MMNASSGIGSVKGSAKEESPAPSLVQDASTMSFLVTSARPARVAFTPRQACKMSVSAGTVPVMRRQFRCQVRIVQRLIPQISPFFAPGHRESPVQRSAPRGLHRSIRSASNQHRPGIERDVRKRFCVTWCQVELENRQQFSQHQPGPEPAHLICLQKHRPQLESACNRPGRPSALPHAIPFATPDAVRWMTAAPMLPVRFAKKRIGKRYLRSVAKSDSPTRPRAVRVIQRSAQRMRHADRLLR